MTEHAISPSVVSVADPYVYSQPSNTFVGQPSGSTGPITDNNDATYFDTFGNGVEGTDPYYLQRCILQFADYTLPAGHMVESIHWSLRYSTAYDTRIGNAPFGGWTQDGNQPLFLAHNYWNGAQGYTGAAYSFFGQPGGQITDAVGAAASYVCPDGQYWDQDRVNGYEAIVSFPASFLVYGKTTDLDARLYNLFAVVRSYGPPTSSLAAIGTTSLIPTVSWTYSGGKMQYAHDVRVVSAATYADIQAGTFTWDSAPYEVRANQTTNATSLNLGNISTAYHPEDGTYYVGVKTALEVYGGNQIASRYQWSPWSSQQWVLNRGPRTPTLLSPANNAHLDLASGPSFSFQFNHPSGHEYLGAYAFARTQVGGTTYYWNASTQQFSGSVVWNTVNAVLPYPTTVTFPAASWANQTTYTWTVDTRDQDGQTSGRPLAWTVVGDFAPTVGITAPSGTITSIQPTVAWTFTDPDNNTQDQFEVKVFPQSVVDLVTFDPAQSAGLSWGSGVRNGSSASAGVEQPPPINTDLVVFVRAHGGAAWSPWGRSSFRIAGDAPASPLVVGATPDASGRAQTVQVLGMDNLLSWPAANPQQSADLTFLATYNATATLAASASPSGTYAVKITATSGTPGEARVWTPYDGTHGIVVAGTAYVGSVSIRTLGTQRSCQAGVRWIDGTGALIRTDYGLAATNSSATWTRYTVAATAPASAVGAEVVARVASPATNEVHYLERPCLKPDGYLPTAWSRGGLVGWGYAQVQRADHVGSSFANAGDPVRLPAGSQLATVLDWTAPQGSARYRAVTLVYADDLASTYAGGTAPPVTATAPGPPGSVTATGGTGQATVTWTAPASNGGATITSYRVTVGSVVVTLPATSLSTVVTGVPAGTYTPTVAATNSAGTGPATSGPSITVASGGGGPTVPGAPTNAVATLAGTGVQVTWTAPASNGGSPITSYSITLGGTTQTVTSVTPVTFSGLVPGTYTGTVAAVNAVGTGSPATTNTVTVPTTTLTGDIRDAFGRTNT